MKYALIVLSALTLTLGVPALAGGNNGNNGRANSTAVGVGVGVGVADAEATSTSSADAAAIGVNSNRNLNVNRNTAEGGDALAVAGGGDAYAGVEVDNRDYNANLQGQDQEQYQGQDQGQYQDQTALSLQGQKQSADNEGVSNTTTVEGDVFEAPDLSDTPGYAPTLYVDACSAGVGGSIPGAGASFATGNDVCLFLAVARAAHDLGDTETATWALRNSAHMLRSQTRVSGAQLFGFSLKSIPLVGRLF